MSYSISESIVTGSITAASLKATGAIGKKFIDVHFVDTVSDVSFRNSYFLNVYFGSMNRVNFANCSLIKVDLAQGYNVDVTFDSRCTFDKIYLDNLNGLKGLKAPMIPEGNITFFKKLGGEKIATLLVPAAAKRSKAYGGKCRAEYAFVTSIVDYRGNPVQTGYSWYDPAFRYEVGKMVKPSYAFDEHWWDECSSGIHGFLTLEEAKNFNS